MANAIDYIGWRGDLSFSQSGLNEVDNVLLVFVTFMDLNGIVPSDLSEGSVLFRDVVNRHCENVPDSEAYYGALMPNGTIRQMLKRMARSKRFGNARVAGYVNEINEETEEQFSALTTLLDDGSLFVSFKGTDDTLVGWKEDLNLSFNDEVSGQRSAVDYLNRIAGTFTEGKIRIGGHSKGGNFAVFAAAKCEPEIQKRISRVYNNDGPGFSKEFLSSEGYLAIKPKVLKLVPQESVVGMLLGNDDSYTVVNSLKSGVLQHNSYLWEVYGRHFVRRSDLTKKAIETGRVLNEWIEEKDVESRKVLSNIIFEILTAGNAKTLTDFNKDKMLIWKSLAKIEPQKRNIVFKAITELMGKIIAAQMPTVQSKKKQESETDTNEKTGN